MGEYADMLIDSMIDGWEQPSKQVNLRRRVASRNRCNRCGETNLRWQNVKGGEWRLHTVEGELHTCSAIENLRGQD